MLFEQISYPDDFPIHITIGDIRSYPVHYHRDNEFVLVLKGEIRLKNGYCTYTLHEGDVFTNASREVHQLYAGEGENTVAVIQISTRFFSQYFPELPKACYRTYTNKERDEKYNVLLEKLLQLLEQYLTREFHYKSQCTYLMLDLIDHLDRYFNLFSFDGDMVIGFESTNQLTVERISRIINYIYEFHPEPITLKDLAAKEHLSTYYISHLFKNNMGMSFREFLCFARAERSEIALLESNRKISRIAREVGFSTTEYYEKFFRKWHGQSPEEYRKENLPYVLSDSNLGDILPQNENDTIRLIHTQLSTLSAHRPGQSLVHLRKQDASVREDSPSISKVGHMLDLIITAEDYEALGVSLFVKLQELSPRRVSVLGNGTNQESAEQLLQLLSQTGYNSVMITEDPSQQMTSAGFDSVAYPLFVLNRAMNSSDPWLHVRLRDPGDLKVLLKGHPAALFSCSIKKPVFYAYQALSKDDGELVLREKNYCVIRGKLKGKTAWLIIAYNYSDSILALCTDDHTAQNVKNVLGVFRDELELTVSLTPAPGQYTIYKYSINKERNPFAQLAAADFPETLTFLPDLPFLFPTEPEMEYYTEDIQSATNINFTIRGVGVQLAIILPS